MGELESVQVYGDVTYESMSSIDATSAQAQAMKSSIADACRYTMVVVTPLACTSDIEQESLDRLNDLGVFGYTKRTNEETMKKKQHAINEKITVSEQQKMEKTREAEEAQKREEEEEEDKENPD